MDSGGQDPRTILGRTMSGSSRWSGCAVIAAMVLVELLDQGLSTVSKAAITRGMSSFVFILYQLPRHLHPPAYLPPFLQVTEPIRIIYHFCNDLGISSLIFNFVDFPVFRSQEQIYSKDQACLHLPNLSPRPAGVRCILQLFKYIGIGYSSPTLSSIMSDLTPAFTFILAIISRMEKLELRVQRSNAKFIGTSFSIVGALTVTLFKGPPIISNAPPTIQQHLLSPQSSWIMGAIFFVSAALVRSLLYIVQTWIIRDYPAELVVALGSCLSTAVNSGALALVLERDPSAWRLKPGIELITIVYSAVFVVAIRNVTHAWACRTKGPLYVSMFKPLGMVFAIVMGVSLLKDTLYLGSVVGAVIIAVGFYAVIWGKAQEEKIVCRVNETNRTPLLNTKAAV